MPRDKVGIVGRNGAGKTSLFKVLGGAVEPHGGKILRKGAFGYLPQDPKIPGAREQHSQLSSNGEPAAAARSIGDYPGYDA